MQRRNKLLPPLAASIIILCFIVFSNYYFPKADLSHLRLIDQWRKENLRELKNLVNRVDPTLIVTTKTIKIDNNKGYGAVGIIVTDDNFQKGEHLKKLIEDELKPPFTVIITKP
jgi:hypothetical protein